MARRNLIDAQRICLLEERIHLDVTRADGTGVGKEALRELTRRLLLDHAGKLVTHIDDVMLDTKHLSAALRTLDGSSRCGLS